MELGLTQEEVSRELKKHDSRMDVSMVSRFETGACLPPPHVLWGLENVLKADRHDLLGADVLEGTEESEHTGNPEIARVVAAIPFGHRNAVPRRELAARLGMEDRRMRKLIEAARAGGAIIINASDGRGYYQSDDLAEMTLQYRQDRSRALSILKRQKTLRRKLKEAGIQV